MSGCTITGIHCDKFSVESLMLLKSFNFDWHDIGSAGGISIFWLVEMGGFDRHSLRPSSLFGWLRKDDYYQELKHKFLFLFFSRYLFFLGGGGSKL